MFTCVFAQNSAHNSVTAQDVHTASSKMCQNPHRHGWDMTDFLISLRRFMPTWQAVIGSSLVFGAAHLSAKDFPQLMALGIVMGFAYVRSRNLLTPMLIHGTWNGAVLTLLFALTSAGVNLDELLGH